MEEMDIKGLTIIPEFIDKKYETELIKNINASPWNLDLKRRTQHYGYKYDYRSRNASKDSYLGPFPKWLEELSNYLMAKYGTMCPPELSDPINLNGGGDRGTMCPPELSDPINLNGGGDRGTMCPPPDQIIINEYQPGQGIQAHIDKPDIFGEHICSISLGSPVIMIYSRGRAKREIYLQPRSFLHMTGEARYQWYHSIPARDYDEIDGKRIKRGTRYSITFRKMILE